MKNKKYLVIGVYEQDVTQRFAATIGAESAEAAEDAAHLVFGSTDDHVLIIAGTIEVPDGQELNMSS